MVGRGLESESRRGRDGAMKTLVTGGPGFIGRHLVGRLAAGRSMRCIVRPLSDTGAFLRSPDIELVYGDVRDRGAVTAALKNVDTVYHLAVDYSRSTTDDVACLLDACRAQRIQRFIYFSSVAVAGPSPAGGVVSEATPCRPVTEYGRLKLLAEEMLLEAHARDGFPVVIVRPTAVYGPGETNFWLPLFQAVHGRRLPALFGDGANLLSLCFIENLLDGVLLAEQSCSAIGNVYILSDERPYSFREVVEAIADASRVPPPRRVIPKALAMPIAQSLDYLWRFEVMEPVVPFLPGRVRQWMAHYPCSVERARSELGYRPKIDLSEGVRRTVEWYRQNGFLTHSLAWADGVLDAAALPVSVQGARERAFDLGRRSAAVGWKLMALSWRVPRKVIRRVRRKVGWGPA